MNVYELKVDMGKQELYRMFVIGDRSFSVFQKINGKEQRKPIERRIEPKKRKFRKEWKKNMKDTVIFVLHG